MLRFFTLTRMSLISGILLLTVGLSAQNLSFTVSGKVVDNTNSPLIGVTVVIPGLNEGTTTGINGDYSIKAEGPSDFYIVEFSYVGYGKATEQIDVKQNGQQILLDITLSEDALSLDEVVVVGSSVTSSRRSLGNSIASIKSKDLTNANPQSVLNSLQGRVAGAQIVQNSGDPAGGFSVRLRGSSSILGSSDPLFIVDGVVISNSTTNVTNTNVSAGSARPGTNRMADINPNDIESVEVINGAAAAAIYGSRASNGVVLITTKKGQAGEPVFSYSTGLNVNELREQVYINLRGEQFGSAEQRLYPIAGTDPNTGGLTVGRNFSTDKVPVQRFNYQDEVFQTGIGTDQHLSVKGGNASSNYYAAVSYTYNEGIIRNSDFQRYGARIRFNQSVNEWMNFSVGLNYNNSFSNEKPDGNVFWSPINSINITNNIWDITQRDELGNLQSVEPTRVNPLSVIEDFDITQEVNRAIADVRVSFFPFEGFNITYLGGIDAYNQLGNTFIPPYPYAPVNPTYFDDGYASTANSDVFLTNHDINASYTANITPSIQSVTQAGYSNQYSRVQTTVADGRGLAPFVETVNGASIPFNPSSGIDRLRIWGYYLQQTFSYEDRLFLTLAGRIDGASSFSPDNREQFYPKISGSYLISDEDFWKTSGISNVLSTLRLRASWGQAGNLTGIGPYARFNTFTSNNLAGVLSINQGNTLANPDVRPERQTELEFGADLSLFNDRVGLTFTYYQQDIEDLLVNRALPASQGGNAITTNVGDMENVGVELSLNANAYRSNDFSVDVFATYSQNRNKVSNLGQTLISIPNSTGAPLFLVENEPIGVFFGTYHATDGNGDFLLTDDGLRQQERGEVVDGENVPLRDGGQPTGDVLRQVIGDPNPDFVLSFGSEIKWKNFSFNFLFESVQGVDVFDADKRTRQGVGIGEFAEQELTGELPRGWVWSIYPIQEWRISDGSFTKLREATISYTIPSLFGGALDNTVISFGGRNIFSIDNFTSFDPEVNAGGQSNLMRGVNFGTVPIPRVYTFTIKTNF
ncbi:MAG: SusC/RagA family TonB-linked outer membrane protein [Bacteroidota bacterium]